MTKARRDSRKSLNTSSLPFHILQEGDLSILIHRTRPSWLATNEVGREIAVRYFKGNSHEEIARFLNRRFSPSKNVRKDIEGFIENLGKIGFSRETGPGISPDEAEDLRGILFLVTQSCNLSCHHCSVESFPSVSGAISRDVFNRIVDEAASLGVANILISGGEPLLRSDIFDLLEYAAKSLKVSLLTNGTLIASREAQLLRRIGVSEIVLSLDGATSSTHDKLRGRGNFRKVMRGIDFLRREGLGDKIHLNFCLSRLNIGEAIDFLKFAEQVGVNNITFLPVKKVGRASGAWEDLRPSRKEYEKFLFALYDVFFQPGFSLRVNIPMSGFHPVVRPGERVSTCPFGTQLIINGEGDIYTCPALFVPEFHLGNILQMSLEDAWNSPKLKTLREKYRSRMEKIARCRECTWRSFCRGGCTSAVYLEKDTFWEADDFCELRDKLYRRAIMTAVKTKASSGENVHGGICSV